MDNQTICWVFTEPPAPWLWVGIFVGVVALVMTAPPIFQMICGRPKLVAYFNNQWILGLSLAIQNMPITNKFLKLIHVRRDTVDDLSISIAIYDKNTDPSDLFADLVYSDKGKHLLTFNDITSNHIRLSASYYWADTYIIRAMKQEQDEEFKTYIYNEYGDWNIRLKHGLYSLHISLCADGKISEIIREFKVNNHEPWVEWTQIKEGNKILIKLRDDYDSTQHN